MGMYEILDIDFKRLAIMFPEHEAPDNALKMFNDRLQTSTEGGVYTLDFSVFKDSRQAQHIKEGNYITFNNRQGYKVLCTIMHVDETGIYKDVSCEDACLYIINRMVDKMPAPAEPKHIDYYLERALAGTGFVIGQNEGYYPRIIEYTEVETLLARTRRIMRDFGMEFYFEAEIESGAPPSFKVHIVRRRTEGSEGFRVSSDDAVEGLKRRVSIDNIVTRLIVRGASLDDGQGGFEGGGNSSPGTTYGQPVAQKFDGSKSSQATSPITDRGWSEWEVDQFNINQADPSYVNGAYIDDFLKRGYPDSPLIGMGDYIKKSSDYWGISVGAAMGVWAKETVFGRSSCGGRLNFGCIKWTSGSPFPNAGGWIDPPDKESAINAWFKLARYRYVEQGLATYDDFLDTYAPTWDGNDHATFKNLMWGVLKAFGYDTTDSTIKNNFSKESDNPLNVNIGNINKGTPVPSPGGNQSPRDSRVEKMIQWFEDRRGKVTYSMTYRSGPNSYDCSSAVYSSLFYAGFKPNINWLGSTVSLWDDIGSNKLMTEINRSQVRRGDIFLSGPRGAGSAGAAGHTGVFLDKDTIIHCNYADNGISRTPVQGRSGTPLYCFRLNGTNSSTGGSVGGGTSISNKTEQAVQNCLAGVGRTPYVWGGTTTSGWDCSGMIYSAYRAAGFSINHRCTTYTIQQQQSPFRKISASEARRGDLVIQHNGGHVAVLLGTPSSGAGIVHAANEQLNTLTQTSITNVNGYYRVVE